MKIGNWLRVIPLLMASIPLQTPCRVARMPGAMWHVRCIRLCCNTAVLLLRWHRSCRSWSSNLLCTPASDTLSCPMCPCIVEAIVHLADIPTYLCPGGNEVGKEHAHADPLWHPKDVEENTCEGLTWIWQSFATRTTPGMPPLCLVHNMGSTLGKWTCIRKSGMVTAVSTPVPLQLPRSATIAARDSSGSRSTEATTRQLPRSFSRLS